MRKTFLTYALVAVGCLTCVAAAAADGTWTHFTGDNIIVPTHVIDMAVDHDDVLWAGNWYGLWSYDGAEWTTWWLGRHGEWLAPYPGDDALPAESSGIIEIAVDNNNVKWFTLPRGVVRYDGATWDFMQHPDTLISIAVDHDNVKWFGTWDNGIWRYDETSWVHCLDTDAGLSTKYIIEGATVDAQNIKWFIFHDSGISVRNGIIRIDGSEMDIFSLDRISEWTQPPIAIAADNDGVIWTGTGESIIRFENEGLVTYCGDEYIGDEDGVYDIKVGPDNVKWFGTGRHGVIAFDDAAWTVYDSTCGLPDNQVLAIAIDSNSVKWFGTDTGVSRLEGMPVSVETPPVPAAFSITGNYPNPFNPGTTIEFTLYTDVAVSLDIHDITGRHVKTLAAANLPAGRHAVTWNGNDDAGAVVSSGIYFCRMSAGGTTTAHRMILVR